MDYAEQIRVLDDDLKVHLQYGSMSFLCYFVGRRFWGRTFWGSAGLPSQFKALERRLSWAEKREAERARETNGSVEVIMVPGGLIKLT